MCWTFDRTKLEDRGVGSYRLVGGIYCVACFLKQGLWSTLSLFTQSQSPARDKNLLGKSLLHISNY